MRVWLFIVIYSFIFIYFINQKLTQNIVARSASGVWTSGEASSKQQRI